MRFLIDVNLPPILTKMFVEAGHESTHLDELGLRHASDKEIWQYALRDNFVIVTKDFDFADLAVKTAPAPNILWLRLGNCSNSALIATLSSRLVNVIERLELGDGLIEIR